MTWRARTRVNLGGGKRRGPEPSHTGTNRNLNIGTESRFQTADALVKEPKNHPKMSKLWDSETGPNTHNNIHLKACDDVSSYHCPPPIPESNIPK